MFILVLIFVCVVSSMMQECILIFCTHWSHSGWSPVLMTLDEEEEEMVEVEDLMLEPEPEPIVGDQDNLKLSLWSLDDILVPMGPVEATHAS